MAEITHFRRRRLGKETKLEDAIIRCIPQFFRSYKYKFWAGGSVPLGAGFPDIVIVTYKPEVFELSRMNNSNIHILAYLRSTSKARIETISKHIGFAESVIGECLEELIEAKAVKKTSSFFTITRDWRRVLPEIIAIETKVTNWRRAITQAGRNRIFSNRSLVALPEKVAQRVKREPALKQLGLGLVSVSEKRDISVIRRGKCTQPSVWSYYYQLAFYVASHSMEKNSAVCDIYTTSPSRLSRV